MREPEIYARPPRPPNARRLDPVAAQRQLDEFAAIVKHAVSRLRSAKPLVEGSQFSLVRDTLAATSITANQCQLKGPVGPGVVVNP